MSASRKVVVTWKPIGRILTLPVTPNTAMTVRRIEWDPQQKEAVAFGSLPRRPGRFIHGYAITDLPSDIRADLISACLPGDL